MIYSNAECWSSSPDHMSDILVWHAEFDVMYHLDGVWSSKIQKPSISSTWGGGTETRVSWSLCAMWCCHGAKDWEERHAANVNHIFIQNASIYLTDRKLDTHMDRVFFDSRQATC